MLKKMTQEELEMLSYSDLTELILKEENKPLNTPIIFKKICDLLSLTDTDFTNQIGEYYTSLSTDKRFVFLETNEWDLREKHPVTIILDEDDEEEVTEEEVIEEEIQENIDDIDAILDDEDLDDVDDDLDDLSVIEDEEIEE